MKDAKYFDINGELRVWLNPDGTIGMNGGPCYQGSIGQQWVMKDLELRWLEYQQRANFLGKVIEAARLGRWEKKK